VDVDVVGELEIELLQTQTTQKTVLRVEVGARALRNQMGGGGGVGVGESEFSGGLWGRSFVQVGGNDRKYE